MSDIIVGLDIGNIFIRTIVGEFTDNGTIQIVGTGKAKSPGLRNGSVVNIEATMQAIKQSIEAAEMVSGYEIHSCVCSIGGTQIESENSKGVATVSNKGNAKCEIKEVDMARAIEMSKVKALPPDRHVLHVIPRSYTVDGQEGIKDPRNMLGVRLEAESHLITVSSTAKTNIENCIRRAGYDVDRVMVKSIAAAKAVMLEDELEIGSLLIDLGGGSTDVVVLMKGAPICTFSIPIGSNHVTKDIEHVKKITWDTAEKIKLKSGCCWEPLIDKYEEIIIPGIGGRGPEAISRNEICEIIQARMEELFNLIRSEVEKRTKITYFPGNIVFVGGGAQLLGVAELAQYVFNTSAIRLGVSNNLGGIVDEYRKPEYATAVGLVVGNIDLRKHIDTKRSKKYNEFGDSNQNDVSMWKKMKQFFSEFF